MARDAPEPIGGGGEFGARRGGPAKVPLGAGHNAFAAPEPGDPVPATDDALVDQLLLDPQRAVGVAPRLIGGTDVDQQGVVALLAARGGPPAPGIVPTSRDAQHRAEAPEAELGLMGRDEVELHFWSSAK